MGFAGFEDWDACIAHMKNQGYDQEAATRICGMLQGRFEQRVKRVQKLAEDEELRIAFGTPLMTRVSEWYYQTERHKRGKLYKAKTLAGGVTDPFNMGHGTRYYSEEEKIRAARTLAGRPINLNHTKSLWGENYVVDSEYHNGSIVALCYIEDENVHRLYDEGLIVGVSVELEVRDEQCKPLAKDHLCEERGIIFTGLAIVSAPEVPGDLGSEIVRVESNTTEPNAYYTLYYSEAAVSSHETPKAPEEREWDADAAERRVRAWATDGEEVDWRRYRQAFAWYDEDEPELFGSYKLPHHDIIDGRLVVVWRGVAAAMAVLMGARGGVDIPDEDRRSVYAHLARHYRQFEREPPSYETAGCVPCEEVVKRLKPYASFGKGSGANPESNSSPNSSESKVKEMEELKETAEALKEAARALKETVKEVMSASKGAQGRVEGESNKLTDEEFREIKRIRRETASFQEIFAAYVDEHPEKFKKKR